MSVKIGSTVVIGDDAKVDWGRLKGVPSNVPSAVNHITKTSSGGGNKITRVTGISLSRSGNTFNIHTAMNCNCNCDCRC